ncbi:type II toxin-antitoxin system PemK/MazF family toxin [Lachnospiraceae bacterium 54-53]
MIGTAVEQKAVGTKLFLYSDSRRKDVTFRDINESPRCGEIRYAFLPDLVGGNFHMQRGVRPVLIVSNDANNRAKDGNVQVIPFTSKDKTVLPTHVKFTSGQFGLERDSTLMAECETQIPARYVYEKIGYIDDIDTLEGVANAILVQHGIFAKISNRMKERNYNGFQKSNKRVCYN